ncbi:hypothetical protein E2C01_010506 [Portunus trituberculatus]|uniref:Uncharacterized protein n=1 Tax=Portunus trituberculatus TaxID=210409 RepID=A0A5B7D8J6_PORTR|nr:hypothetical protein [Portunus trituberculatus]
MKHSLSRALPAKRCSTAPNALSATIATIALHHNIHLWGTVPEMSRSLASISGSPSTAPPPSRFDVTLNEKYMIVYIVRLSPPTASGDVRGNEEARKAMNIYSSGESEGTADSSCASNVSLIVNCSDQGVVLSSETSHLEVVKKKEKEKEKTYRVTTSHRREEPRTSKRRHVVKSSLKKTKTRKPRKILTTITTKRRLAARLKLYAIMHNDGGTSRGKEGPRANAKRKRSSESSQYLNIMIFDNLYGDSLSSVSQAVQSENLQLLQTFMWEHHDRAGERMCIL